MLPIQLHQFPEQCIFFFYCYAHHRDLHSFPTRRSSDLQLQETSQVLYRREIEKQTKVERKVPYVVQKRSLLTGAELTRAEVQADPNSPGNWQVEFGRSEEHTSELQSLRHLVCRLLLEKK